MACPLFGFCQRREDRRRALVFLDQRQTGQGAFEQRPGQSARAGANFGDMAPVEWFSHARAIRAVRLRSSRKFHLQRLGR